MANQSSDSFSVQSPVDKLQNALWGRGKILVVIYCLFDYTKSRTARVQCDGFPKFSTTASTLHHYITASSLPLHLP